MPHWELTTHILSRKRQRTLHTNTCTQSHTNKNKFMGPQKPMRAYPYNRPHTHTLTQTDNFEHTRSLKNKKTLLPAHTPCPHTNTHTHTWAYQRTQAKSTSGTQISAYPADFEHFWNTITHLHIPKIWKHTIRRTHCHSQTNVPTQLLIFVQAQTHKQAEAEHKQHTGEIKLKHLRNILSLTRWNLHKQFYHPPTNTHTHTLYQHPHTNTYTLITNPLFTNTHTLISNTRTQTHTN